MFRADFEVGAMATFKLSGEEGKHAANVRRMRIGESIQVSNGLGGRIRGTVSVVKPGEVEIEVQSCQQEVRPDLQLTLVQALAKGDRDELAIQAATELGISRVIPWQADNSVSRWPEAKVSKSVARWQAIVAEAAKQSMRSFEPQVLDLMSTNQLVTSLAGRRLVLDPTAPVGLASIGALTGEVAIVVGPEGGISGDELSVFSQAGFERVHLGDGILRTSTAGVAAIAAISAFSGIWK